MEEHDHDFASASVLDTRFDNFLPPDSGGPGTGGGDEEVVTDLGLGKRKRDSAGKKIIPQLLIKPEVFPDSDVISLLKGAHCYSFFFERQNNFTTVNPSMIKEFYSTLEIVDPPADSSKTTPIKGLIGKFYIGGQQYSFENIVLGKLTKLPTGEAGYSKYSRRAEVSCIFHKLRGRNNEIGTLAFGTRVLFYLVSQGILPQLSKNTKVLSLHMVIVDKLLDGVKVDIPILMMQHMEYCKKHKSLGFPYPLIVKDILNHLGIYQEKDEQACVKEFSFTDMEKRESEVVLGDEEFQNKVLARLGKVEDTSQRLLGYQMEIAKKVDEIAKTLAQRD